MSTIKLKGSSSGEAEVTVAAAAGTPTFTLPTTVGSANQLLKNSGTAGTLQYSSTVEDSSGRVLMGTTTVSPANTYSDNLIVSEAGDAGISIRGTNSNSNYASIYFQDAGAASRAYFETQLGSNGVFSIGKSGTGNIRFVNNGAQRATIDSSGNLGLDTGNLVIGTSGKGIDFSANSDGPGTSESELFHIYEEGYWQPTWNPNFSVESSYTNFQYTRVGRLVTIRGYVYPSSYSGTDSVYMSLPFASLNDAQAANAGAQGCMFRYIDGCTGGLTSYIGDNSSYMYFYRCESGNGAYNSLSNDEINSGAVIYFSHTYAAA